MSVKLTNFVKINIKHTTPISASSTRDTAVLLQFVTTQTQYPAEISVYSQSNKSEIVDATIKKYSDVFFDCGGKKLAVYQVKESDFAARIEALPAEYIMMTYCCMQGVTVTESSFRTMAKSYNDAADGIYKKIFVSRINAIPEQLLRPAIENYVLKYSSQEGTEASVLAYFTKLKLDEANSLKDYMFTTEVVADNACIDDDNVVKQVIQYNYNADIKLGGVATNIGGNDTAGNDLSNQFALLVLHQTLSEKLLQVLQSKIRYDQVGVSKVLNAITGELNRFRNCGYLTTDQVWKEDALYYKNYKIIDTNTPLINGYHVVILPFESLSDTQRKAHQFPDIYILAADSYSIRLISIDGQVF